MADGLPAATMAVNVSAKEFRDQNFSEGLFAILEQTGLDPRSLELELTESVLMKNAESAATVLRLLREKGVQVAVDDFGTGYSSLSYLRKFPVDALKIDQSFVGQITATGGDASIVSAVISMARSLELRVVAEGVETLEQLAFLRSHQCDEAQGYYFSRPVPPEQFAKLLRTGIPLAFDGCRSGTPYRVPSRGRPSPRVTARGQLPARGRRGQAATVEAAPSQPRRRVLVDDDDPSFGPSLRKGLAARATDVECVATPDEAMARVSAASPDPMDADLLTRAVENILDKAVRFIRGDGRIEIEVRAVDPEIEIRISMGGATIPVEARRAIFDRYVRAEGDLERTNLGSGLYFWRLAIEAQGGRIWIDEAGVPATVFVIRLPRLVSPTPDPPTEATGL